MKTPEKIIIIDLEATCWNGKIPAGQKSEIIEIGMALLNTVTGEVEENKGLLIKPRRSRVSPFCTELTTLTQEQLDREGMSFSQACDWLFERYHSYTWASYGAYDIKMMQTQCIETGIRYPFSDGHINVKQLFTETRGLKKKVGMAGALGMLGLSLEGTHHRGVDDARNIAKILYWCLTEGKNGKGES